jgi:hypothetical protein
VKSQTNVKTKSWFLNHLSTNMRILRRKSLTKTQKLLINNSNSSRSISRRKKLTKNLPKTIKNKLFYETSRLDTSWWITVFKKKFQYSVRLFKIILQTNTLRRGTNSRSPLIMYFFFTSPKYLSSRKRIKISLLIR